MTPTEVALSFVAAINSGDPDQVAILMAPGHTFVDSDGVRHSGRQEMRRIWERYFTMVPDYRIEIQETIAREGKVALFGMAEGTFAENGLLRPKNHWAVPAAWCVVVEDDRVGLWQLYVNPGPMVEILRRIEAG